MRVTRLASPVQASGKAGGGSDGGHDVVQETEGGLREELLR